MPVTEIQTFRCVGDAGRLSVSWNGYHLTNVPATISERSFEVALQSIPGPSHHLTPLTGMSIDDDECGWTGIDRVTVTYSTPSSSMYSHNLCTPNGNDITVEFVQASVSVE